MISDVNPKFSIIIPLYNEENRLTKTAEEIFEYFLNRPELVEIIFVNDGSVDRTKNILDHYNEKYNFTVISYSDNKGKGYAVKWGALAAKGQWIVFFDIDLATPLSEFEHLVNFLESNDQIIIGSRRLSDSQINKSESVIRTFLGHGFTKLSNILVPKISDFTCGFKCFSNSSAKKLFSLAKIDRWGFDTELLYIAKLKDIPIREMSVCWRHDGDSRVSVFKAIFSSLKELIQMKLNQLRGLYT